MSRWTSSSERNNRALYGKHSRTSGVSNAPFHEEGIGGKTLADMFDVQAKCFTKGDDYRPHFLIAFLTRSSEHSLRILSSIRGIADLYQTCGRAPLG